MEFIQPRMLATIIASEVMTYIDHRHVGLQTIQQWHFFTVGYTC